MSNKTPKTKFGKQMLYILLPFVLPLCLIILGIVLLANAKVVNGIFLALGILIALVGLVEVVIYASRKKFHPESRYLVTGIILMVIGALLIILPFTINNLIPIILGLSVLGSGISGITNTLAFRREDTNILASMLFAVTNCLLGVFILIYVLFISDQAGWNVIGILMIISGVLRLINEIIARVAPKHSGAVIETTYTETTTEATEPPKEN